MSSAQTQDSCVAPRRHISLDELDHKLLAALQQDAGRTLYDLYEEAHTPWDWHAPIFERARANGLIPFSASERAT